MSFSSRLSRSSRSGSRRSGDGRLLDGLHVDLDLDLVADQDAAGLQRLIPLQTPLAAVDLGRGVGAGALAAPRIFAAPFVGHVEGDLDLLPADSRVADEL